MVCKRAQQSSFGMSFNMIFSIFLIIVFIAIAIYVIVWFIGAGCDMKIGQFYVLLQDEVNDAFGSSYTENQKMSFDLCGGVTHVCFANLSAPVTGDFEIYELIRDYEFYDVNTFLIPPGAASPLEVKNIEHLDLSEITTSSNPYCVSNPGEVTISKGVRSRLVMLS